METDLLLFLWNTKPKWRKWPIAEIESISLITSYMKDQGSLCKWYHLASPSTCQINKSSISFIYFNVMKWNLSRQSWSSNKLHKSQSSNLNLQSKTEIYKSNKIGAHVTIKIMNLIISFKLLWITKSNCWDSVKSIVTPITYSRRFWGAIKSLTNEISP